MSKGTPFYLLQQQAINNGAVAAGAKLYFYQTGTTTQQTVYQESTLSTGHTQPITADSDGVFDDIWLNPDATVDYRVKLTDSDDNTIWQIDDVPRYRENFDTGTFEVSYTGFSADPSNTTASYFRFGRIVSLDLPIGTGTSNSTQFSMSGLPDALVPDQSVYAFVPYGQDNSAHIDGVSLLINTSGKIICAPGGAAWNDTGWTNSGTKGILTHGQIFYILTTS